MPCRMGDRFLSPVLAAGSKEDSDMCECLLEAYETMETPDSKACEVQVHTTYNLSTNAVVAEGFVPRAGACSDVSVTWLGEDEI